MKLLFCNACKDVIAMRYEMRYCKCGMSGGHYTDDLNATYYGGHAVPLGFANASFDFSLRNRPIAGAGQPFKAFVIPKECPTVTHTITLPKKGE